MALLRTLVVGNGSIEPLLVPPFTCVLSHVCGDDVAHRTRVRLAFDQAAGELALTYHPDGLPFEASCLL